MVTYIDQVDKPQRFIAHAMCSVVSGLYIACQAPLVMGFLVQEKPIFSSKDLPSPGTEPVSPVSPALLVDSLPTKALRKPHCIA